MFKTFYPLNVQQHKYCNIKNDKQFTEFTVYRVTSMTPLRATSENRPIDMFYEFMALNSKKTNML